MAASCVAAVPAAGEPRVAPQVMFSDALTLPDAGPGAAPVTVCVVDSGADADPSLRHALTERLGVDGTTGFTNFIDDRTRSRHGTLVSQVIAGTGPVFRTGVWPHAKLRTVGVSYNRTTAPEGAVAQGIDLCLADRQVRVINLSIGSESSVGRSLAAAVERARGQDVNVVVSAGNTRDAPLNTLASLPGTISVSGVGLRGERCGSTSAAATLIAQSCQVVGTDRSGGPDPTNGTSFAAPQASAVLAAVRAHAPTLNADQAVQAIVAGATPGPLGRVLNARGAMRQVGVTLPPTDPLVKPRLRVRREGSRLRIAVAARPRGSVILLHRLPYREVGRTQRLVTRVPVRRETVRITFERGGVRSKPAYVAVQNGRVRVY